METKVNETTNTEVKEYNGFPVITLDGCCEHFKASGFELKPCCLDCVYCDDDETPVCTRKE